MASRSHCALGVLIGAALERQNVRKVSSVFHDGADLVVTVEFVDPALDEAAVTFAEKSVAGMKAAEMADWADELLDDQLGVDDGEEGSQQDEEQDGLEDPSEA